VAAAQAALAARSPEKTAMPAVVPAAVEIVAEAQVAASCPVAIWERRGRSAGARTRPAPTRSSRRRRAPSRC
jgi:hypothetical protein